MSELVVTTPCRLMYALPKTSADDVRDLIVLERGETEYDARSPWRDLGVSRGKVHNVGPRIALFKVSWHEKLDNALENDLKGGGFSFAVLWKTEDVIHGLVAEEAELLVVERPERVTEMSLYAVQILSKSAAKRI